MSVEASGRVAWRERPGGVSGISAARLAGFSFLGLIAVGAAGFRWLPGLHVSEGPGWIDALFMATSAVCVTGLVVVDVSQALTFWGQLWLLLLIQAGALGILTLAGLLISSLGGRLSLRAEEGALGGAPPIGGARRALRLAVGFTLCAEALGAAALWLLWAPERGPLGALWPALFHAVSAFCNAGFSLFSDSLTGQREHLAVLGILGGLIALGGIGFPVVADLIDRLRGRRPALVLHTRVVLLSTGLLLGAGALLYLGLEWDRALAPLATAQRVGNALFMSVTARTAGFNTVEYADLSNASVLLTIALMCIGGAPAGVAGGVKVTTAALLFAVLWARLIGERGVSFQGRTVPEETVQRAVGLAAGAALLLTAFAFGLLALEPGVPGAGERRRLVALLFETQSAFSTVGLSMGVTDDLSGAGRLLLVPLMLLGRLGPIAVLAAMQVQRHRRADVRYAHEDVLIG